MVVRIPWVVVFLAGVILLFPTMVYLMDVHWSIGATFLAGFALVGIGLGNMAEEEGRKKASAKHE
jgi:hypothetical protein